MFQLYGVLEDTVMSALPIPIIILLDNVDHVDKNRTATSHEHPREDGTRTIDHVSLSPTTFMISGRIGVYSPMYNELPPFLKGVQNIARQKILDALFDYVFEKRIRLRGDGLKGKYLLTGYQTKEDNRSGLDVTITLTEDRTTYRSGSLSGAGAFLEVSQDILNVASPSLKKGFGKGIV